MEACPICGQPLVPFRAKLVCRTPGCGFMENCCDGGWMSRRGAPATCRTNDATRPNVVPSHSASVSEHSRQG
jgi:hypothetical protein